jgi:ankyrin repeat protein
MALLKLNFRLFSKTFSRRVNALLIALGLSLAGHSGALHAASDPYRDFFESIARDDAAQVRLLMLRGISPNSPDPNLGPAVVHAARSKAFQALKALIDYPGVNVNATNAADESALMYLAMYGDLELAGVLIQKGAIVNKPDWAPLHYAAMNGELKMIDFLLERSAYIDAASENGTTPMMMAARSGKIDAVKLLVERGADPSQRNRAGLTAADYLRRLDAKQDADWLDSKAAAFVRRYGTDEQPVKAPSTLREEAQARDQAGSGAGGVQVSPVQPRSNLR